MMSLKTLTSRLLVGQGKALQTPIESYLDPQFYLGAIVYGDDGQFYASNGSAWTTLASGFTGSVAIGFTGSRGFTGSAGPQGTSITVKGTVLFIADLPIVGNTVNDAYIVQEDENLYIWDGAGWNNAGKIVGPQGLTGDTGFSGSRGFTGSKGFDGSRGFDGSQGFVGSMGYTGSLGFTGSRGDIGYTGSRGETGFTGSIGNLGFTGSKGDIGFTGSDGIKGDTGFTGSAGPQGDPGGFTGSKGDAGFTGSKGDVGFTGSQGPQGDPGGFTGSGGLRGFTGSEGIKGDTGFTGSKGDAGGFTGSKGDKGDTGFTGSAGAATAIGYTGSVGPTGFTGSKGDAGGYTGSQGPKGDTGFTGSSGAFASVGFTGSKGDLGFTGSQGPIGFTGSGILGTIINITNDTTTNATRYVGFVGSTSGEASNLIVSSSKLFFNPSTGRLSATEFASLSDVSTKERISTIGNSSSILNALNPVEFYWKDNGEKSYGVIAQELEKVLPELVVYQQDKKYVNYMPLIAILVDGYKYLENEVKKLKGE
jgi:collagen type IV alpha